MFFLYQLLLYWYYCKWAFRWIVSHSLFFTSFPKDIHCWWQPFGKILVQWNVYFFFPQ
jgi:hypothetical protein